jgi:hypothetical protein
MSRSEKWERFPGINTKAARPTFARWRAEGCDEIFDASFDIPDPLLVAFDKKQHSSCY